MLSFSPEILQYPVCTAKNSSPSCFEGIRALNNLVWPVTMLANASLKFAEIQPDEYRSDDTQASARQHMLFCAGRVFEMSDAMLKELVETKE